MTTEPLFIFMIVFTINSCQDNSNKKYVELQESSGEIAKGRIINDGTFDGRVDYYDSTNTQYLGYTVFKNGYERGPMVRYKSDIQVDSIYYEEPVKNGYEYLSRKNNKISYKAYLLDEWVVGPAWDYPDSGRIHFYFYNFEGDVIYECKYDSTGKYQKGSVINLKIYERTIDNKEQNVLFLWLITPNEKCYYELAIFDKNRKKIRSTKIETDKIYYRRILEPILPEEHYGIIYNDFGPSGDKGNVIIQEMFL